MESPYNHTNYKDYLLKLIASQSGKRGFQTELAEAAGCQRAYLSQVLRSHIHLTPEHACGIANYLGLGELETDYFLTLVDFARAGSRGLQQRLQKKLASIKQQAEHLAKRLKRDELESLEAKALYYSSWQWAAIHMAVHISELQTPKAISERLRIPVETVMRTLQGLRAMGLVKHENQRWFASDSHLHIPRESPLNCVNHQNWRNQGVLDSQNPETDGVHYSVVFSLSRQDFELLKTMLLKFIDQLKGIIGPSPSEELVCFTADLFKP